MTGAEFREWIMSLSEEDSDDVLMFTITIMMDEEYPNVSISELRSFVNKIFESRPNKTWDSFMKWWKE